MTLKSFKKIFLTLIIINFIIPSFADDKMTLGLEVYNNKAQCGVCHILQAAGSDGLIGPNLDQLKPKLEKVISTVTNGIGVMPSFEGILSTDEINSVAHYVYTATE